MDTEFDSLMADVLDEVATTFGGSATYTPLSGDGPLSLTDVTFVEVDPDTAADRDGSSVVRRGVATVAAADVAAPVRGDMITLDATVWTVITAKPLATVRWQLMLTRSEPVERARDSYRSARRS